MNYQKALNILGLKSNFTEEELKKAYRKLSHQYHPDKYVDTPLYEEMTRKQQVINEAYNYLKKSTKTNQTTNQSIFDIELYIFEKYNKLDNIVSFDFDEYKVSENIKDIIEKIGLEANWFSIATDWMTNKQDINNAFNKCLQNIKNYFKELKKEFYRENDIDENDVKENIDYDCTLKEFYEQLLKIKNKYSKDSIINKKYNELKNIVNFNFNEYKISENISAIIKKIKNVIINFGFEAALLNDEKSIDAKYLEHLKMIKYLFKELEEEFYKETGIQKENIKETINYDCTLKEFYDQLLKIKNKYSKESIISNLLEDEIQKYTSYAGYERIKVLVRYHKTKTLNKIKENGFTYTQKDIDDMHQSILECFNQYYSLQQKMLELESKIDQCCDRQIDYKFAKIKNKFKTTVKFDEIKNSIKELEAIVDKHIMKKKKLNEDFKDTISTINEININEIYVNLITRYSEALKEYNFATQSAAVGNLSNFLNEVLKLFKQGIEKQKSLDFFNMFNEITFKNISYDNKILENINKVLNKKFHIYIKTEFEYPYDDMSFFYLDEENMIMHKLPPHNAIGISDIISDEITQDDLEREYMPIEKFLEKSIFIGENKTDYLGGKYGLICEMYGYSLYLENHQFCIGYNKTFLKTSYRGYTYLDEFENKEHLIELIEEEIKKRFEEGLKKTKTSEKPSSKPTSSHSYNFSKILNEEKQYNTSNPYGYEEPKGRKK